MTNKLKLLIFPAIALLSTSCDKHIPFDLNRKNSQALTQINFTKPNLFPEGVAYDALRDRFYVSSAAQGTVGIVTRNGNYTPFITDEKLTGTLGIKVDKSRERLWVSNMENGIGVYDLNTGTRIFYTDLSVLLPGSPVFINDVALDKQGNAYITNSFSPVIYRVDRQGNAEILFRNDALTLPPGEFGFNGIQYDERGFLLVAFSSQIIKILVGNPTGYSIIQLNATIFPDGLLLSKNGRQLVVVSNGDGKVLSFTSNDEWKSGHLSSSFSTGAVFPTTATSDGKNVYVLYSHLDKFLSGRNHDIFTIQEVPLKEKGPF